MLQNMRDGASRWLVWVVIGIVIIALSLWGISSYFMDGGAQSPPVAKINGIKITENDLSSSYNRLRQQQPKLFTAVGADVKIKKALLGELVNQSILAKAALDEGFAINQDQIDSFIASIPAFQANGQFSQAQFSMVLNRLLYTPAQFTQDMKNTMLINQVRNGLAESAFAMPNEASTFIALVRQKRDFGYSIIPAGHFSSQIKVNAQEISDYYEKHQAAYAIPEKVSMSYVEITPEDVKNSIKPTRTELLNFYQNNIASYTTPSRWHVAHILLNIPAKASEKEIAKLKNKLANIRSQIIKGASFSALAKENSDDIISAHKGGVTPWFVAGTLGPIFEQTAAFLKPGQVSQPVQTRYGLELIKLIAVQKEKIKPYSAVAGQIKQTYVNQLLQKRMDDNNDELANLTFENPATLAPAAKQMKLIVRTTPFFTRVGTKTGITALPNVVATAFSDDVLDQDNNSNVITLKDNTLIVLRVKKHIPAAIKPLKEVSNEIKQSLIAEQSEALAAQLGAKLVKSSNQKQTASSVVKANGFTWTNNNNVTRQALTINKEVLKQAFNMAAPNGRQKIVVQGIALSNGDYAIVGVTNAVAGNASKVTASERDTFNQQVEGALGQSSYNSYVKTQKDTASIKYYAKNQ